MRCAHWLGNRRALMNDLHTAFADERLRSRGGAVRALFDLDGFKEYGGGDGSHALEHPGHWQGRRLFAVPSGRLNPRREHRGEQFGRRYAAAPR